MRFYFHLCFLVLFFSVPLVNAEDVKTETQIAKLVSFLDATAGKKLKTQVLEGTADDGSFNYEYQKTVTITRVAEFETGVSFTIQNIIRQKNIPTGSVNAANKDRVAILFCEIGELKSTNRLLGYCRTDVSGTGDPIGEIYTITVDKLDEKTLIFTKDQVFYSDIDGVENEVKANATKSVFTVNLDAEIVTATEKFSVYSVDDSSGTPERTLLEEFELELSESVEE